MPPAAGLGTPVPFDPALVATLVREARASGDARRGAELFASAKLACVSCHRVSGQGGTIGPELTAASLCLLSVASLRTGSEQKKPFAMPWPP